MDTILEPTMKRIAVIVIRSDQEPIEVVIMPDTTASALLKALNLEGYYLFSPYCLGYLAYEEEVFSHVSDGDKLYAYFPSMQPLNPCFSCQFHVRRPNQ